GWGPWPGRGKGWRGPFGWEAKRPCVGGCPAEWDQDSFGACTSLPGTPEHVWEARRESFNDGDAVGTMTDYGANATDLVQATAGNKPTYRSSGGPGNRPYFSFDGADYVKSAAEGTNLAQPNLVVLVVQTNTTAAITVTDGFDSNPRTRIGLTSTNAPWQLQTSATTLSANNTVTNGQWEVFIGTINGASSTLRLSGFDRATGDAGAHAYAPGTVGCNFSGAACLNGGIALFAVYDTPPDIPTLEAAIEDCYGEFPQ
ncbi:MAG: hypothetical protein VW362_08695, partial [Candidatus Nanopelagicales bacterium]